jgi:hypothetical protein
MAGVCQNIDPPQPSLPGECVPPAFGAGGGHIRWLEGVGGGGQYFGRRQTSALYSTYVGTLWLESSLFLFSLKIGGGGGSGRWHRTFGTGLEPWRPRFVCCLLFCCRLYISNAFPFPPSKKSTIFRGCLPMNRKNAANYSASDLNLFLCNR